MANYTQYIPAVNSTTYPVSINDCFTALTTDVSALETDKLNLAGGTMTGALIISTGGATLTAGNLTLSAGNMIVSGTVDGRDIATDGTKLDAIEASATADQTGAEIKTAYELEADTNAYDDAAVTKLGNIETLATADQTGAEIKTAYELEADTNAYDDAAVTSVGTIAAKAPIASPTFTGTPSLPTGTTGTTQSAADNSTKLATTAYADAVLPSFRGCLVGLTNTLTINDESATSVLYNIEQYDTDTIHDLTTNKDRLYVPTGVTKVRMTAQIFMSDADRTTITDEQYFILKNGLSNYTGAPHSRIDYTPLSQEACIQLTSPILEVTDTDYFTVSITLDTSGGAAIWLKTGGQYNWFAMEVIE